MLKISIWKIGSYWQIQVFEQCACCDCEPNYFFDEQANDELELHRLIKQAVIKFNQAEKFIKTFTT